VKLYHVGFSCGIEGMDGKGVSGASRTMNVARRTRGRRGRRGVRRVEERGVERVGRKQKAYNNQRKNVGAECSQVFDV
jgi:hypothetical protein